MPLTKIENCKVGKGTKNIVLILDGHRFSLDPETAFKMSNALGNAATDQNPEKGAIPVVREIELRPDAHGAWFNLYLDVGPLRVRIDHIQLQALSAAALAVLELGPTVGEA